MLMFNTFLILGFAYFVTSSVLNNDQVQQTFSIKSYNNNHPSLFEANKPLTDVDVLEVRKVRQVTSLEDEKKEDTNSSKKLNLDSEVPVTVVTDSENNISHSKRTKKRKQTRRQNPAQNLTEELKIIKNEDFGNSKETFTERPLSTSPSPRTVVPKVFTKRPPQYNPIFKKVRQQEPGVKIVRASNHVYAHNGNFEYSFEGADGTKVSSEGELKSFNGDKTGEAVVGSVFYKDNEGNNYSLSYTADENGYRPHGDHLPTPPPIPKAIARALEYLATKTTPEPVTEAIKNAEEHLSV